MGILSLIGGIPAKAWGYVILLAALGGCGLYLHHRWYSAGVDSQAPVVAKLQAQVMALQSIGQSCLAALKEASDGLDALKADADLKEKTLAKFAQMTANDATAARNELEQWKQKYKQVVQSKDCATTASMQLCTALRDY